jgi:hypothetical protein
VKVGLVDNQSKLSEMAFQKGENIFGVVFPFYVILKLSGMFPKSFQGEIRLGVFKTKWHDKVISLVAGMVLLCVILQQTLQPYEKFNKSMLLTSGWQIR